MLTRNAIRYLMSQGLITVTPDPVKIGPNSIDLRLGDTLKQYHPTENRIRVLDPATGVEHLALDPKNPPPLIDVPKVGDREKNPYVTYGDRVQGGPDCGFKDAWLLVPGQFYLGATLEETYCRGVVPHLDGRSTCGRLSIEAHKTAGVGDNGFRGRWTLEIEVTEPVLVAPGDRLFQIYFTPAWGLGVAHLIRSLADGTPVEFHTQGEDYLSVSVGQDPKSVGRLFELNDLISNESGHHYQGSQEVRGASPLD